MKKYFPVLIFAVVFIACHSEIKKQKNTSPAEYDDLITSRITQMQQLLAAVQEWKFDSTQIDSVMKKYADQIDSVNKIIKNLSNDNSSKQYKNAATKLGDFYKKSIAAYYANIAKIYRNIKDTAADVKVQKEIAALRDEETKISNELVKERKKFAQKNKLKLENEE
jgi:conjugal transfer/entry exclusion protein